MKASEILYENIEGFIVSKPLPKMTKEIQKYMQSKNFSINKIINKKTNKEFFALMHYKDILRKDTSKISLKKYILNKLV